jgi:2-(1,2-epoxy-1,2-dihydrophenyl)acetyl-CoA isomerase
VTVRIEQADGVLRLTLDRPEKRNALDDAMVETLITTIEAAGHDESVRVIVIAGAGPDFCSGFDILSRNRGSDGETGSTRPRVGSIQRRLPATAHRLVPLLLTVQTPVVAVVRGWAAGLGLHLALAADFAVAADSARFWEPFMERGFTPDSGGTWLLPRRVGDRVARQMLLLGRQLDGTEAAECGLVYAAWPEAQLDGAVDELVGRLATGPTVSLGLAKWLLHSGGGVPLDEQLRNEAFAMELSSRSEDFREGLQAFAQKRPPRFTGR